ncbi:dihydrodipicolinate synthase family protein [Rhodopirellula sp. P2]|uniref:dihydrodipicolinate synthase family protein n=1 Tax=Rhodopirellula sp. P2 TaxID=2127060 RepID=UPI002368AC2D|nr:dihydrodipicolinate synthase family protein [Rhodopirellula sp. P2]WDQ15079.1 dihydrodipicolinate synthase family protein [Rhodopirellula sp. P2]
MVDESLLVQRMSGRKLSGLIAATYTPMTATGDLRLDVVPEMVEKLLHDGISGLYVCGSTGEGMSLTTSERHSVAAAFVEASGGRLPVIIQVGHNSLREAQALAAHAQEVGANAISATCPSYFKVSNTQALVQCMKELASAAPETPFYYYHIPMLTGSSIDMPEFLTQADDAIPTLVGLKYTDTKLFEFQRCLELANRQFDVVWGCDEMLLGATATGARAAIGSTYNIAAKLYRQMTLALTSGQLDAARKWQSQSIEMISTIGRYPFHPAMKAILAMQGLEVGSCRLPLESLSPTQTQSLRNELQAIGFFDWFRVPAELGSA